MRQSNHTTDKAGKTYWDAAWQATAQPRLVVPNDRGLRNHVRRRFHEFFYGLMNSRRGQKVIEVGCANSIWLPYFATEYGCTVTGLGYSTAGCASAEAILKTAGVAGSIIHGDVWNPPADLVGAFDVVSTYGLVEHFEPTEDILLALAKLLKPGGLMITIVPNMVGWAGLVQKYLNRPVFDIHVPINLKTLQTAHQRAGLTPQQSHYLCSINFGVLNLNDAADNTSFRLIKKFLTKALIALSALVWWIEDHSPLRLPPNRLTSPYIACIAIKSDDSMRQPHE
jgi:cyclopropane fatty-acyl-phospholipid synthase-like methyltransferase